MVEITVRLQFQVSLSVSFQGQPSEPSAASVTASSPVYTEESLPSGGFKVSQNSSQDMVWNITLISLRRKIKAFDLLSDFNLLLFYPVWTAFLACAFSHFSDSIYSSLFLPLTKGRQRTRRDRTVGSYAVSLSIWVWAFSISGQK